MQLENNQKDILVHMLGAGNHIKKRQHGFRNYFCSSIGNEDHRLLLKMEASGLVKSGRLINQGSCQYFYATEKGCDAIGLSVAAKKRALCS